MIRALSSFGRWLNETAPAGDSTAWLRRASLRSMGERGREEFLRRPDVVQAAVASALTLWARSDRPSHLPPRRTGAGAELLEAELWRLRGACEALVCDVIGQYGPEPTSRLVRRCQVVGWDVTANDALGDLVRVADGFAPTPDAHQWAAEDDGAVRRGGPRRLEQLVHHYADYKPAASAGEERSRFLFGRALVGCWQYATHTGWYEADVAEQLGRRLTTAGQELGDSQFWDLYEFLSRELPEGHLPQPRIGRALGWLLNPRTSGP